MKNIRIILSENRQFLEVRFSIYVTSRVFVMGRRTCQEVRFLTMRLICFYEEVENIVPGLLSHTLLTKSSFLDDAHVYCFMALGIPAYFNVNVHRRG